MRAPVVVAGAGGPAGQAVVRRLTAAGTSVVGVDASAQRLEELAAGLGDAAALFSGQVVDLTDEAAVTAWAPTIAVEGAVAGLVHLVGGWRGGSAFADNTAADWQWLESLLIGTLRNTTLALHDSILASDQGRVVLVSATAVTAPTAGNAGYAAAKAAAETWTMAMADSFGKAQSQHKTAPSAQRTAATVLVVKALVHDQMRVDKPEATFAGYTDVTDLADTIASLWDQPAAQINGLRKVLAP